MAQKTKPATKATGKAKARPAKAAPAKGSAKKKGSVAKPAKAPAKAKSAPPKAAAPPKSAAPPKIAATPKMTAPPKVVNAPKAAPQIARAKSALKREQTSLAAASPKPEKARARKISIDISPNEAASALAAKWSSLHKRAEQIEAKPYNMTAAFEERTAIVHKVLGWGYILTNRNDRLEVLFKDGIKYLISNYKP